jgi:hypothetical protein
MSATLRAMGPAVSRTELFGVMPAVDTSPTVGRSPTSALLADGDLTEPPVSVPMPTTPKLAANEAPVPPEEPPVPNAVSYAAGELGERGLRQDNGTRGTKSFHQRRILGRIVVLPSLKTRRHGQSRHVDIVLHDNWDAVQGADRSAGRAEQCIESVGILKGAWIDGDERIDQRATLVISRDAVEMRLRNRSRRRAAGEIGRFKIDDRGFLDGKRAALRLRHGSNLRRHQNSDQRHRRRQYHRTNRGTAIHRSFPYPTPARLSRPRMYGNRIT